MRESVNHAKLKGSGIAILILISFAFVFSVFIWKINNNGTRRVVLFESKANPSELSYEVRFLRNSLTGDDIKQYVDEILLGPISPQARLLFPLGTNVRSCFVSGKILYLDLSEEALQITSGEASNTVFALKILKKNLFTNFKNIDIINLFIMGKKVEA